MAHVMADIAEARQLSTEESIGPPRSSPRSCEEIRVGPTISRGTHCCSGRRFMTRKFFSSSKQPAISRQLLGRAHPCGHPCHTLMHLAFDLEPQLFLRILLCPESFDRRLAFGPEKQQKQYQTLFPFSPDALYDALSTLELIFIVDHPPSTIHPCATQSPNNAFLRWGIKVSEGGRLAFPSGCNPKWSPLGTNATRISV